MSNDKHTNDMAFKLDAKIPAGELAQKWSNHKAAIKVVSPANKRKLDIIIVGTGLGGASAAASLGELGYNVKIFCIQDSPRRAHSIAAQGGINAAKNYQNDNDSIYRLFYDTIKGGDYRAREANVYRLAEVSNLIIDQCVAQGVPFAREYGGLLANRSFGGAQVSRTFYARGQTGQQLLLGAYAALNKEIAAGSVKSYPRHEMLDIVVEDGEAKGIIARNLVTGEIERHGAHAVVIATGGYGNVFFLSTNAMASNGSAAFQCYRKGAGFANPCFTQIHPTCIPVHGTQQSKLTLMSESLRNDGRIWVPKKLEDVKAIRSGAKKPSDIAEEDRDYYLERRYPAQPMQIFPAVHYTMGGIWVDYNLMTTIPGLYAIGEANFSDHGANRLGASALMQGLADGYFVLPYTIGDFLSHKIQAPKVKTDTKAFDEAEKAVREKIAKLFAINGKQSVDDIHKKLGHIMWENVGMARTKESLEKAIAEIQALRKEFWKDVKVVGKADDFNVELEKALRLADFLELGELMARDALDREESCGGHFRSEHQTPEGEALRHDETFAYASVWEYKGMDQAPELTKEPLEYEFTHRAQRNYKD